MLLSQCTSKSDGKTSEATKNEIPGSDDATCIIGEFDMFSTTIDAKLDNPIYGEQDIDMKCRWNEDNTIIRNTAGIEQHGSWSIVDNSLLVVRIDSLFETIGTFVYESPAYDTSVIQQCDDHHLVLTSSSNEYTSTITWVRKPK